MPASEVDQQPIYVRCQGVNEYVAVNPNDLPDNAYDVVYLLKLETAPRSCWRDVASAYFRARQWEAAITVLEQATSDDVENVLRGSFDDVQSEMDNTKSVQQPCSRLDLLAALGGAHIMMADASAHDPERRKESLRKAADVISLAEKIELDDPSIWTARGWAEFHAGKSSAASWFDNARDKNLILGSIGLAALHLSRGKPTDPGRRDPVSLLVSTLRTEACPPGVWTGLAYALYREGRINAARNVARRALAALRNSPPEERLEALYILALVEVADPSDNAVETMAIILREAFLKCGGDRDARILTLLANLYFNAGDFESSELTAGRAVDAAELMPSLSVGALFAGIQASTKVDALFQLARAQHHLGKCREAMHGFSQIKSIAEAPDGQHLKINPGVYLRLGLLKLATERKDDEAIAKECLEKALKLSNDRCGIAKRGLGVLIGREVLIGLRKSRPRGGETYERAVTLLTKGIAELKEDQCDVPATLVYAALVEEYHPRKALDAYKKAIKAMEEKDEAIDSEIWNNYASLLSRCGKEEEAFKLFQEKVGDDLLQCPSIPYNRARLMEMVSKSDEAEKIFRSLPKDHPHHNESIIRLAVINMARNSNLEEAEKFLKEAMESSSLRATAITYLSALYTLQKNFKQAQEILEANRAQNDYLNLLFSSFMHRFLDSLDQERRSRFLINHIGTPLINLLKRNNHNASAANGVGVYFAESKMLPEARDAFISAGSGPSADKVTRVNLAHIQIQLGIRELKESAKFTGRPSARARSNSKSLYEQSDKLYTDALEVTNLSGSRNNFNSYCELLLYSAWAQFEGGEYRRSADTLGSLLHLMPSCSVGWFNLSQALLESAMQRVNRGSDRLEELELAKDEFEGSRAALNKCTLWKRPYVDPLARVSVPSATVHELLTYVRQEAKSHEVNLRNAINMEEDRKEKLKTKARELEEHERKQREKQEEMQMERHRKEMELRRAFEESQRRQRENEENYQRILAAKRAAIAEDDELDDDEVAPEKKNRSSKRKRKDSDGAREKDDKVKKKRPKKAVLKKAENESSGEEYSDDLNGLDEDGDANMERKTGDEVDTAGFDDRKDRVETKRKKIDLGSDDDVDVDDI